MMRQKFRVDFKWLRILLIILLVSGIFFRFANLEQKPYWGDESLTSQRIAGYTSKEFQQIVTERGTLSVEEVQKYQRPGSEKDLMDLIKKGLRSPLYHLIGRSWMNLFSDFVTTPRGVSALISLLAFPCMYLLCWELFNSRLVGAIAVSLIAVSPLHVIYAQEAREYSMWTVTVLLSSWALLRAARVNRTFDWMIYAATLTLSLQTHLFSIIVAVGHGLYLATIRLADKKIRLGKKTILNLLISFMGLAVFIYWRITSYNGFPPPPCWTGWNRDSCGASSPTPFPSLAQTWILNLSRVFIDLNKSFNYRDVWLYLPIAILVAYSLYFICRHTSKRVWLFIYTLVGVLGLFLAIPDIILGGQGSTPMRYLLPCYLGIQIAIAYLFAYKITSISPKVWKHHLWKLIALIVISGGVLSSAVYIQTDTWWNKYAEYYHSEVAKIVDRTDDAVIIVPWFNMRTLSHVLSSEVIMQDMTTEQEVSFISRDFDNVFIYKSQKLSELFLENNADYKLKDVYSWKRQITPVNTTQTTLWHFVKQ